MRASEADVLINAVKTFVLFSLRTNVSFLLKVQNKMDHELDKDQKKGVTGLRGMELFSSTSLSSVLMNVEPNNWENMQSSRVKRHMV